jgi:hypothetical protein
MAQTQEQWASLWGRWADRNAARLKHYIGGDIPDDSWHEKVSALYDRLYRWIREHGDVEALTFGTIDAAFDALVTLGLEKNPSELTGKEKQAQAELEAAIQKEDDDFKCDIFYLQHSSSECEEAAKKNPYFRNWLDTAKYRSFQRPEEAPAHSNLFIVRGVRKDNRAVYVANDSNFATAYSREHAVPLGRTRSENAAQLLRKSGHYVSIQIEPIG